MLFNELKPGDIFLCPNEILHLKIVPDFDGHNCICLIDYSLTILIESSAIVFEGNIHQIMQKRDDDLEHLILKRLGSI